MKKFFRWLPAMLACAAISVACSDNPTPDVPPGSEVSVRADTPEGANIDLVAKDYRKIEWTVTPGADCASYRVEVLPYARYKNDWFEMKKGNPEISEKKFAELRMFATEGNGAGAWEGTQGGVSEPRDFSTDMSIFQTFFLPNTEYIIMVYGCLNSDGTGPGEYTSLRVTTPAYEGGVIGNPKVAQEAIGMYRYTKISYTPNDDCAYYFMMDLPKTHVTEILEEFDEATLADIICSFSQGPSSQALDYTLDWGFKADPKNIITSVAVALDGNYMHNKTVSYCDYHTKERDPNMKQPEYEFTMGKASSRFMYFKTDFPTETTVNVYYALVPSPSGLQIPKDAIDLATNGWGVSKNGVDDQWWVVEPETTYRMFITARNAQSDLIDPMEDIEVCTTKPVGHFNVSPDKLKVDLGIEKTKTMVTFTPDEDIAIWFHCILETGSLYYDPVTQKVTDIVLTDPKNVLTTRKYLLANANISNIRMSKEAYSSWGYTGQDPDKDYTFLMLGETWDGNYIDVQYIDYTTMDNPGGKNPAVTFGKYSVSEDKTTWSVEIVPNADSRLMRYCGSTETAASAKLDDPKNATDEQKLAAWTEYILGDVALTNYGTTARINDSKITDDMLTLAISFGSENAISKLAVLRLDYDTKEITEWTPTTASAHAIVAKILAKHNLTYKPAAKPAKSLPSIETPENMRGIRCK